MPQRSFQSTFTIIAIVIGVIVYIPLYFYTRWNPYLVWLITWTVVTFILYGYDKLQAKRHGGRVPEIVLHGLALIGGALGGWAGMALFWHKVRKPRFWFVLIAGTLLHGFLFFFLVL